MLLRTRSLVTFFCLLSVFSVALVGHFFSRRGGLASRWAPILKGPQIEPCPDKLDWLGSLDLTYPIQYAYREIIIKPVPGLERTSITKLDSSLLPNFQTIDLTLGPNITLQHCEAPLILDIPTPIKSPVDASHIIFGISTTLRRLDDSILQLSRWLPHTRAKLFVIVIELEQIGETETQPRVDAVKANPVEKEKLQSRMRGLGMDVSLVEPLELQDSFSEKYFSLLKILYGNRGPETQWISLLDDDTFFPSMPALLSMLGKYDPQQQHYIGGLSEDWWSVTHYGMMAFGGAGVFLSVALSEVLVRSYQLCKETSHSSAGDIRIMECIYLVTNTKLTNEGGLHQIDLYADLSGIYESGTMPLSLHHWKPGSANDEGYNLPLMHLVSDVCGDCFLQRWQFGQKLVLTNGFSIAQYPKTDLSTLNLENMEATWGPSSIVEGSNNHGTDHSLAPTRPRMLLEEEKIQYKILGSAIVEGGVRQSYLHRGIDGDMDSLIEILWSEKR